VVLAVHGRKAGERRWVVWAAGLVLVQLGQIEEALEAEAHTGEVEGRRAARIEVLMHRAIGDVERAALVPVEPLAIYDAEAFPSRKWIDSSPWACFPVCHPTGIWALRTSLPIVAKPFELHTMSLTMASCGVSTHGMSRSRATCFAW